MKPKQKSFLQNLDWVTTILPFGCITLLCCLFMIFPEGCQYPCFHPFLPWRPAWQLLSVNGTGGCDLFPVYGIFPLWFY